MLLHISDMYLKAGIQHQEGMLRQGLALLACGDLELPARQHA